MKINQLLETPIDMTGDPNDPVVYGHEKANPMSLKGRIVQARNQLKELAQLAESDDLVAWEKITRLAKGGMFMGLEQNLEQIRHGIEQLAAKRKQGGVASRGIDKNIGEQDVAEGSAHGYNVAKWYEKSGGDQMKLTRWLRKEAGLPKDAPVYFDDADLVYDDTTIVPNALVNPKLKFNDLLTAVVQATGGTPKQNVDGVYRSQGVAEAKQKGVDGKACWDGYKRMGAKKKGGKTVDNCVPTGKK